MRCPSKRSGGPWSSVRRADRVRRWSRGSRSGGHGIPGLTAGNLAHHLVDEAVFLGLHRGQVAVAIGVPGDSLDRLAGVAGEDLVDDVPALDDLLGLDLDVGDLPADLAIGLMDHDLGVRQREAAALGAAGQQDRGTEAARPMQ